MTRKNMININKYTTRKRKRNDSQTSTAAAAIVGEKRNFSECSQAWRSAAAAAVLYAGRLRLRYQILHLVIVSRENSVVD